MVLTAEHIQRVYGAEVLVRRHPETGRPYVVARTGRGLPQIAESDESPLVHVICGAGTGEPVFDLLLEQGIRVTAGVVNVGDSDQLAAERLGLRYVDEAPFTAIGDDTHQAHLRFVEDAAALLLTPFPLGPANTRNLEAARHALALGKPVFVMDAETVAVRDFSGGHASQRFERLLAEGAEPVRGVDEVIRRLTGAR